MRMAEIESLEAVTGESPTASVIILHGLGADGNDFVPVAQEMDLTAAGPVRYVFPNAPVRPVTINGGYRMRAWYDILGTEASGRQDEGGLRESMAIVESLIARERERGVAPGRIVVAGFSQGCAMALMTGVRHAHALGGIVGMSGYLPLASSTASERSAANERTPIFLAHGNADEVVVFERGLQSRDQLRALGYDVEWHEYPMGHSVCMEEIRDLEAFLNRVLAPRPSKRD
jgi:phospholipase/carboxylesterase